MMSKKRLLVMGEIIGLVCLVLVSWGCYVRRFDNWGRRPGVVSLKDVEGWRILEGEGNGEKKEKVSYFCPPSCGITFAPIPFYVFWFDGSELVKWKTNSNIGQVVVSPRGQGSVISDEKKEVVIDPSKGGSVNRVLPSVGLR